MLLNRYKQQPRDNLKRIIDLTRWLEDSEIITEVDVEVSPETETPLVCDPIAIDPAGKKFAYFITGGEDGQTYTVTFLTTTQQQTREDEIEIDVEEV